MPENFGKYPYVEVSVTSDRLKAYLTIVSSGDEELDITTDYLKKGLQKQGIVAGVRENALEEVVRAWNRNRRILSNALVAEGVPPEASSPSINTLPIACITDPSVYKEVINLRVKHFAEMEKLCNAERIQPGDIVLKRSKGDNLMAGTTVFGEQIEPPPVELDEIEEGYGIKYDPEQRAYIAQQAGIAAFFANKIELIPAIYDGHVELNLDKDFMKATATFYPPYKNSKPIQEKDVISLLRASMVKTGIDTKSIELAVTQCHGSGKIIKAVIASGKLPRSGNDARIEYLIDFEQSLKPEIHENGTADFKNVSLIKSTEKGDPLAKYYPPTRGIPGINLLGVALPAPDGKDTKLPQGINTEVSKRDPHILIASASGNANLNGSVIEVTECYVVNSDVDYATGNIDFPKTIHIRKDVKSGFNVTAGGDLEVNGIIEDCQIKVDGNILVKAGFLGNSNGLIECKGNVAVGFVRNQKIRCRKNLTISGEAINCKLYARGCIEVGGRNVGIVGGLTSARREIICETAGNEQGTKTQLEVGTDYALLEERYNTEDKIKELSNSKLKIDEHLEKLIRIKRIKGSLPQKETMLLKKLVETQIKVKNQLSSLEERRKLICEKLTEIDKARILVKRTIYPGVIIKIGENYLNIEKEIIGPKSFVMRGQRVKAI